MNKVCIKKIMSTFIIGTFFYGCSDKKPSEKQPETVVNNTDISQQSKEGNNKKEDKQVVDNRSVNTPSVTEKVNSQNIVDANKAEKKVQEELIALIKSDFERYKTEIENYEIADFKINFLDDPKSSLSELCKVINHLNYMMLGSSLVEMDKLNSLFESMLNLYLKLKEMNTVESLKVLNELYTKRVRAVLSFYFIELYSKIYYSYDSGFYIKEFYLQEMNQEIVFWNIDEVHNLNLLASLGVLKSNKDFLRDCVFVERVVFIC